MSKKTFMNAPPRMRWDVSREPSCGKGRRDYLPERLDPPAVVRAAQDHDTLGAGLRVGRQLPRELRQVRRDGRGEDRAGDLGRVAPGPLAVLREDRQLVRDGRGVAANVAGVGIAGHQLQRPALAAAADQDRYRPADGARRVPGVADLVVRTAD